MQALDEHNLLDILDALKTTKIDKIDQNNLNTLSQVDYNWLSINFLLENNNYQKYISNITDPDIILKLQKN
tara:strand:- start:90 stop:302 length:213 start_codon:yes stop_codon:yes gene_type:complete